MGRVPLGRPAPPAIEARDWPTPSVAVFGVEADALASALLETWAARRLEVLLRHAPGHTLTSLPDGLRLAAHPDALAGALAVLEPEGPTVGVGPGFAVGVAADHVVYAGALSSMLGLAAPLRARVRSATLHLERPRPETMRALGRRLSLRSRGLRRATEEP